MSEGTRADATSFDEAALGRILARHPARQAALLPILHDVVATFRYVPAEAVPLIATHINCTRAEVHGVVTFYEDFRERPPGRHVLRLCRAEACQAMGGDALALQAERLAGCPLGETRADGKLSLEAVFCLGLCAVAPSAMLDGKLYGRLDPATLKLMIGEVLT
ncbi:formate dehydrogenase subunit gamma [Prosthecomicrobium pneumaticum]|uniref:Formate dehydrogenase subunit gamma n=1 Tax=Prosthecomicrobium pneumaticum TaxID=81895 RepID=A0A7W9L3D5_9HYPH|nr:formate dehydrogenase subunit gamma [Prosthecomicrobium pneumaticum]MBB5754447.1 formate dehydrogenase subunit gamma [Prosthecomicrobium pneumaticum]